MSLISSTCDFRKILLVFLRGKVPGRLEIETYSEKNRRWLRDKGVFLIDWPEWCRPVMLKVNTCRKKAIDKFSLDFWYCEQVNRASRAPQMQISTQEVTGFWHTFCSASIMSTLFIGPYNSTGPSRWCRSLIEVTLVHVCACLCGARMS